MKDQLDNLLKSAQSLGTGMTVSDVLVSLNDILVQSIDNVVVVRPLDDGRAGIERVEIQLADNLSSFHQKPQSVSVRLAFGFVYDLASAPACDAVAVSSVSADDGANVVSLKF